MFRLKLVLFAILLILGCVFALAQGETNEVYNAENALTEELNIPAYTEKEVREVSHEERVRIARASAPCVPPKGSSTSGSAPATPAPTSRPTSAPTSRPTQAPTAAPTSRPTSAPTSRPTSAPTSAPTSRPTPAPTSRPSTAPTTRPSTSTTGSSNVGLCDLVPTSQEPIKILVPLYVYPGKDWDTVVAAASKTKIVAIINPNSGPLASGPDSSYNTYMTKLKNAGVEMVGYVYTQYGARPIADVKAAIDLYKNKYPGITGIFFDEASDSASQLAYYTQAYQYVVSKGFVHSILNPGVQPAQGYLDIATNIVIFENAGASASKSSYASWVKCAPNAAQKSGYKYKFSGIAHTASLSSASGIINSFASQGMGMVYVTDGAGGCCTYNTLTSYFASEATSVAALN